MMDISSKTKLSNGVEIPLFGLGTYQMRDVQVVRDSIDAALSNGYRLFDTAAIYRNEHMVGEALKTSCEKYKLDPTDVFVTTKLATSDQGYERALAAFEASLQALGRSSIDLYLIHWPGVQGRPREDPGNAPIRKDSWRALEELYRAGKVRAIGVSNYTVKHLEEMMGYVTIKPHVLQSECHPLLPQHDVRAYCLEQGIFFQAYTSLGRGDDKLLKNEKVLTITSKYPGKTPAQILLAWAVQQGIGVIPKASSDARVKENGDIFDFQLSQADKDTLNFSLDESYHFCWDPNMVA